MALACSAPVALSSWRCPCAPGSRELAAPAYLGGLCLAGWPWRARAAWAGGCRAGPGPGLRVTAVAYAQTVTPPAAAGGLSKADVPARMDGWRELAQRVDRERASLGPRAFAAARTYQNAAELGFYLHDRPRVLIVQDSVINHQYRFWNDPAAHLGQDAILVAGQSWELGRCTPISPATRRCPTSPSCATGRGPPQPPGAGLGLQGIG